MSDFYKENKQLFQNKIIHLLYITVKDYVFRSLSERIDEDSFQKSKNCT